MAASATDPSPDGQPLSDTARTVLVRILRVMFPHGNVPDGPYERTADTVLEAANGSVWSTLSLQQGLGTLEGLSGSPFVDLDDTAATRVLKLVEGTEFFGFIRRTAVVHLYNDAQMWEALGYEGPSFDKGGYVDRGFDDLDWLPSPRIDEYDGPETIVEVAPSLPGAGSPATGEPLAAGTNAEASHPGVAAQQAQEVSTTEAM